MASIERDFLEERYPKPKVPYVTTLDGEKPLIMTEDGIGSEPPKTVMQLFEDVVKEVPDRKALLWNEQPWEEIPHRGDDPEAPLDGERMKFESWTYKEYLEQIRRFAKSAIKVGFRPHHSVAIIGFNSKEWVVAQNGAIFAGGLGCGVYATNGPEACKYVVEHSEAEIVVVENDSQLEKFMDTHEELPLVKAYVQYKGEPKVKKLGEVPVMTFEEFQKIGEDVPDETLEERIKAQKPEHGCSLIYTSGTVGMPKGVMISHDTATWAGRLAGEWCHLHESEVGYPIVLSFLPLSHIAAQMVDIYINVSLAGQVYFARPDVLKGSLLKSLQTVRPTVLLAVPRVWEKIMEAMKAKGAKSGLKKWIGDWAKGVGLEGGYAEQDGGSKGLGWSIANSLVYSKVKENLGLDRANYISVAAAPTPKVVHEYFLSLGMPLYEVYGASETSGPLAVSVPEKYRTGAAGPSIHGQDIKILDPDEAGSGEVCVRGRHIFMGYVKDEENSKKALDEDGYYHTGDIGKFDGDFLYLTGRIKELIITAGGENVPPGLIEEGIKKNVGEVISNVCVIGEQRKFLSCLCTLRVDINVETGEPTKNLTVGCQEKIKEIIGNELTTVEEAIKDEKLRAWVDEMIKKANESAISRAQHVQKFAWVAEDFSLPGGELTPTMKLKRRVVHKKYEETIDGMYDIVE